ncbi:UNVERIFIED_CONTAM: hypothetical protein HDU68_009476 [Siphonaria sp. JEL0065]|nr:hypothetical protein HDU68_009476 [Siphonaria sp. JEL0065]
MTSHSAAVSRRDSLSKLHNRQRYSNPNSGTKDPVATSFHPSIEYASVLDSLKPSTLFSNARDSQATIVDDSEKSSSSKNSRDSLATQDSTAINGSTGKLSSAQFTKSSAILIPPSAKEATVKSSPSLPKKVNFWGWVDVGFSHSIDDYDRKPITVDPLTKEDAIEVMEMRLAMKMEVQEMHRWRLEIENSFGVSSAASSAAPTLDSRSQLRKIGEEKGSFPTSTPTIDSNNSKSSGSFSSSMQVKKPDGFISKRDSIATRFQQLGITRKHPSQPQQQPRLSSNPPPGLSSTLTVSPKQTTNSGTGNISRKSDDGRLGGKLSPNNGAESRSNSAKVNQGPPRKWAWTPKATSQQDSTGIKKK